jgi:ketosteroid isomerase-like protein
MLNTIDPAFKPSKPYFDLVRDALGDLVDGDHFFDCVADEIVYEVLYDFPGWPRIIEGKSCLMDSFKSYGTYISIQSADHLTKHSVADGQTLVLEYEVHGTILSTSVQYNNRFCSIIKIKDRKIVYWRDYMDSLAAWNALTSNAAKDN